MCPEIKAVVFDNLEVDMTLEDMSICCKICREILTTEYLNYRSKIKNQWLCSTCYENTCDDVEKSQFVEYEMSDVTTCYYANPESKLRVGVNSYENSHEFLNENFVKGPDVMWLLDPTRC